MKFIPKHYMLTNPLFFEPELIEWDYTDTILVTAYDLLKNDSLVYFLQSRGYTLKEYIRELGFPKQTKIFADSGVFLLEWIKKAKSSSLQQSFSTVKLRIEDIIDAYQLIDPDFLVPLDEIIFSYDSESVVKQKVSTMKDNIVTTLEFFPTKKIVGVIQGVNEETIYSLVDFEKEHGIRTFARGGLIPLYYTKHYCNAIRLTREATKNYKLHAFGITKISQIDCYAKCVGIDSFDSTIAKPLTSSFFYLEEDLKKKPFNEESVRKCNCRFCKNLAEMIDRGIPKPNFTFTLNLYLHNITQIYKYSKGLNRILFPNDLVYVTPHAF
ncbi:MAG: hypothetical protein ACTSYD_06330 [Candidatus Heimdallarchaeaceae archaeon]